jgi:hypothetical protein
VERRCRVRRQRSNGAALGFGIHVVIQREPDESRCAAFCEVAQARGRVESSQSVCALCDCDDLVQAVKPQHTRGRSFTNTALEDMQGALEVPHSGAPPSNECNLPSRAAARLLLACCCLWPPNDATQRNGCAWGLRRLAVQGPSHGLVCGQPVAGCELEHLARHGSDSWR